MKSKVLFLLVVTAFSSLQLSAQETYEVKYIDLNRLPAALYEPMVKTEMASIAVIAMHSHQNYMTFLANTELVKRGYTVLGLEAPSGDMQSQKWLAEKKGVEYLRGRNDIKYIVLLGHSGGATTTTAYQLIAEQGVDCLKDKSYNDYGDINLPAADGIMLLDANYGNGIMTLLSLDPNVIDEQTGMGVEQKLNLTDPAKGYGGNNGSHYSPEFVKEYVMAQGTRLNRLMANANERLELIKAGMGRFADDEPFLVPGGAQSSYNNRLLPQDISLLCHTRDEWPLLHPDGSVTTEVVHCLRVPMEFRNNTNRLGNTINTTVRGFLSGFSLVTTDDLMIYEDRIEGIDWTSNINNAIGNAAGITVPLLCMGMTGGYEYIAAEWIYNASPSKDKTCAFVEGASHAFNPDKAVEQMAGRKFGDTVKVLFDYVDDWLSAKGRFLQ